MAPMMQASYEASPSPGLSLASSRARRRNVDHVTHYRPSGYTISYPDDSDIEPYEESGGHDSDSDEETLSVSEEEVKELLGKRLKAKKRKADEISASSPDSIVGDSDRDMPAPKRKVVKASFKTKTASPVLSKSPRPILGDLSSDEEPITVSIAKRRKTTSPMNSTTPQRGMKAPPKRVLPTSLARRTPGAGPSRGSSGQSSAEKQDRDEASNTRSAPRGQSVIGGIASPKITDTASTISKPQVAANEMLPSQTLQLVLNDPVTVQGLPFQPMQKMVDLVWEQTGEQSGRLVVS